MRRFIAVDDCGVRINPMIVDGQIMGGLAEGVGIALMEVISFDDQGNCLNGSMMDYLIPTALECPDWELGATVTPCPHHPIGAKGVGESATNGSPPAIVNAVCDALYQTPRRRPRRHAAEPGAGLGRDAGQGRAASVGGRAGAGSDRPSRAWPPRWASGCGLRGSRSRPSARPRFAARAGARRAVSGAATSTGPRARSSSPRRRSCRRSTASSRRCSTPRWSPTRNAATRTRRR